MATVKTLESLRGTSKAQPVPDLSPLTDNFSGWGIWTDVVPTEVNYGLGFLIRENRVAKKRVLGWALVFAVLGLILTVTVMSRTEDVSGISFLNLALFGLAGYRLAILYRNRNLNIKIFRGGLVYNRDELIVIPWRDIEIISEFRWYHDLIKLHNITLYLTGARVIKIDRSVENLEELGPMIQLALMGQKLPRAAKALQADGILDFGWFSLSRYGIALRSPRWMATPLRVLPWSEVKSIEVGRDGREFIIHKVGGHLFNQWGPMWDWQVVNLQLFLTLTTWFVHMAHSPENVKDAINPIDFQVPSEQPGSDVMYRLFISQKEAGQGLQKIFYIGYAGSEERLVVKIPPNIKSGTFIRIPGKGQPNSRGEDPGNLSIQVNISGYISPKIQREAFWLTVGVVLFGAIIVIDLLSPLNGPYNFALATLFGCVGGALMAAKKRFAGALSGLVGGAGIYLAVAYAVTHTLPDTPPSTELIEFAAFLGAAPGYGIYLLLKKR